MRIYLKTTPAVVTVPFNYQPKLVGILHKWLGKNDIHGKLALHSFSWLIGGEVIMDGINFPQGATLFISFYDPSRIKQIVRAILEDPMMCYGMKVVDVTIEEERDFSNQEFFKIASPVFIQKRQEGEKNSKHYTYEHMEAGRLMTETLKHKMRSAGLPEDETLQISFALDYKYKKIKVIDYDGIGNKSSWCPLIIKGKPATKAFAWNTGVGTNTGVGFGSIY